MKHTVYNFLSMVIQVNTPYLEISNNIMYVHRSICHFIISYGNPVAHALDFGNEIWNGRLSNIYMSYKIVV